MGTRSSGREGELTGFVCVFVDGSHLTVSQIPPPSPPLPPPGHRSSAAGSAGDRRRTPDPPSARSSWPETMREGHIQRSVCVRLCVCAGVLRAKAAQQGRRQK